MIATIVVYLLFVVVFALLLLAARESRMYAFANGSTSIGSYWPHIAFALTFAWGYLQPGVFELVKALASKYPHAAFLGILVMLIGMYHLPSPGQQKTS